MTDSAIRHAADCTGGSINTAIGRLGDTLQRCRNCGRWAVVPREPRQPEKPSRKLVTRYRCAEHLDEPVTWRGTGCRECERG